MTETGFSSPPSDARRSERESSPYAAALAWWSALQPYREDGTPNPQADRGALARLRRAASPLDVLDEEAVFDLYGRLRYRSQGAGELLPRVAVVAAVLAHVRKHERTRPPAKAVGRDRLGDAGLETAAMKPLRMRRLLQAREPDDVLRQMRRLVDLADGRVDVGALAELILDWFDSERGDKARSRFAYDYYAAGGPPPGTTSETSA